MTLGARTPTSKPLVVAGVAGTALVLLWLLSLGGGTRRPIRVRHGIILGDSLMATPVMTRLMVRATGGAQWDNRAVSGQNSLQILEQARQHLRPGVYDTVLVSVGGNDGNRPLGWTQQNVQTFMAVAHRAGARVVQLTEPPMATYRGALRNPVALRRSRQARSWALAGGSHADRVIDTYAVLGDGGGSLRREFDGGDHLHPNTLGRTALARAAVQAMEAV